MTKKQKSRLNMHLAKVFEANRKQIEEKVDQFGMCEIILDLGNGRRISLGVLVGE